MQAHGQLRAAGLRRHVNLWHEPDRGHGYLVLAEVQAQGVRCDCYGLHHGIKIVKRLTCMCHRCYLKANMLRTYMPVWQAIAGACQWCEFKVGAVGIDTCWTA